MDVVRYPLSPRGSTPKGAATDFPEDESSDFQEVLTRLGVPTYYSKSQFALAENSIFDQKLRELVDMNEPLSNEKRHRKNWLKLIRNYTKYTDIKPLARHFYKEQIPYRYNLFMMKRVFQRWKIRRQWVQLSSIINRINMRRAANDDKERMSERRVLLSAKYLTEQKTFQPNLDFFVLNSIPQKTPKQIQIMEEDEAADRENDRLCQLEFEYHQQEEEEAAERRRRRRRKKKVKAVPQIEEEEEEPDTEQEQEQSQKQEEEERNEEFQNEINPQTRSINIKDEQNNQNEVNNNNNNSEKSINVKQPENSKKTLFILIAILAFVLGFGFALNYYIRSGEIKDTKSFFGAVKTGLFGTNVSEKCQLDPECRKRTEKANQLEEENKRKDELIKELREIAKSKDPETREEWIRGELKKLSGELKSIHEDQEDMTERIIKIKEKTGKK